MDEPFDSFDKLSKLETLNLKVFITDNEDANLKEKVIYKEIL
jgi:hypothetical protein